MAKIIPFDNRVAVGKRPTYSDVEFVQGLLGDRKIQNALYRHWREYFINHESEEFFHLDENRNLIIHNAYIVLWEKVRAGKIYVENDILMGKNGQPFTGTLTTYMMSVAKLNNLELVRDASKMVFIEDMGIGKEKKVCDDAFGDVKTIPSEPVEENPYLIPSEEVVMREILAEFIANMSERCKQILSMFYYKGLKLDRVMYELPSFASKDALKTAKNKCLAKLKKEANKRYKDYLNS